MGRFVSWIKKHKALSISLLIGIVIFLIPKIIDWTYFCYKGDANTTFSASDVLSFWGTLVSGGIVLLGVYLTIANSNKKAEELRIKQIMPKLSSSLKRIDDKAFIKSDPDYSYISIMISDGRLQMIKGEAVLYRFSEYYTREIEGYPDKLFFELDRQKMTICFDYLLKNDGSEAACGIKFSINNSQILSELSIPPRDDKMVKLIVSMPRDDNSEHYIKFDVVYSNIDENTLYKAEEAFTIYRDTNGFLQYQRANEDYMKTEELKEDSNE